MRRDIIVIGASAGGLAALTELVRGLPRGLPAAVFIVIHTSADNPSVLPQLLTRAGALPAAQAIDREAIVHGKIYIAPPDHHLVLKGNHVRVTRGPKENGFRPAVDPLFRTAANVHGPRVVGVVLSGGLDDGSHGLALIIQRGGLAVVQDPQEALVPGMPLSALRAAEVHHVLTAAEIGAAIPRWVGEETAVPKSEPTRRAPEPPPHPEDEPDVAEAGDSLQRHTPPGEPSLYTCPECGGALWEATDDIPVLRFRCHVGHGYTAEALLADQGVHLENTLWSALRALEEHAALYRRVARRTAEGGMPAVADRYRERIAETELRVAELRALLQRPAPQKEGEP